MKPYFKWCSLCGHATEEISLFTSNDFKCTNPRCGETPDAYRTTQASQDALEPKTNLVLAAGYARLGDLAASGTFPLDVQDAQGNCWAVTEALLLARGFFRAHDLFAPEIWTRLHEDELVRRVLWDT